eukprot:418805_1
MVLTQFKSMCSMQFNSIPLLWSLFYCVIGFKNDTIAAIPCELVWNHIFPCLPDADLERLMQCKQHYREWCHHYLQTQRPTFLKIKQNWNELRTFIEGITQDQWINDGPSCLTKLIRRLKKPHRKLVNRSRSRGLPMTNCHRPVHKIEQLLLIILKSEHNGNKGLIADTIINGFDVALDFGFPVITAMVCLIKKIESNQDVNFYHYLAALQTVFRFAQNEYDKTNCTHSRYAEFGMFCIDILSKRSSVLRRSLLWVAVQAEFIPFFLETVSIDFLELVPITYVLCDVCEAIIETEFYGKNNVKYLDLFIQYKHELFDGNELYILRYMMRSKQHSLHLQQTTYLMQFFIDNQLMTRSFVIETARNEFIVGGNCRSLWLSHVLSLNSDVMMEAVNDINETADMVTKK